MTSHRHVIGTTIEQPLAHNRWPGQGGQGSTAPSHTGDEQFVVYTVQEVASILRIGRRQCYELVRTGAIQAVRLGRSWRIPESVLRELIESR